VCGKGAQAAAMTGLVRDVLRVLVRDDRPLPRAVELLNRTMVERGSDGRYCTLAVAVVSVDAGTLMVELCLAGHDRPIVVHADGSTTSVGASGTAVGLLDTVSVKAVPVKLEPGEALVFYTDGVTERRLGATLFGQDRLRNAVATTAGHPAPVVAARLRAAALAYSPEQPRDDIAILVVRNPA